MQCEVVCQTCLNFIWTVVEKDSTIAICDTRWNNYLLAFLIIIWLTGASRHLPKLHYKCWGWNNQVTIKIILKQCAKLLAWIVFSLTNLYLTSHVHFKLFCLCTAIPVPVINQDLLFFSTRLEFLWPNTPSCGDSAGCVRSCMSVAALWTLSAIRVLNYLFEWMCAVVFSGPVTHIVSPLAPKIIKNIRY